MPVGGVEEPLGVALGFVAASVVAASRGDRCVAGGAGDYGDICPLLEEFAYERSPRVVRTELGHAREPGPFAEDEPDGLAGEAT